MIEIMDKDKVPCWVVYPNQYLELIKSGNDVFLPWYLLNKEYLIIRNAGLIKRYPHRELFVCARDDDSDDIACWEKNKPGKVLIIHDYASPGWEHRMEFDSFNDWNEHVKQLMI